MISHLRALIGHVVIIFASLFSYALSLILYIPPPPLLREIPMTIYAWDLRSNHCSFFRARYAYIYIYVDRVKKSISSLYRQRNTYSLTTKNGFSSVIPPSLNSKPGPRPVSPRRSRDTLGGSAIAPRPRAHR